MKGFNTYKLNLKKSMEDKLFFLNKIDIHKYDLIVDFGCGTGELLRKIERHRPLIDGFQLIGYDTSEEMIKEASSVSLGLPILFTNEWATVKKRLNSLKASKSLIIFSSVLHEIEPEEQRKIIHNIMPYFDTVVIRDMKRPSNNEPISNNTRKRILKQVGSWQAEMFEKKWGKIRDKENLYRFFLMNEFVENFESEVEEDYFSVLWSDIAWTLEENGFKPKYVESFILPYRKEQVKKRFNHDMKDFTHRKAIYDKVFSNKEEH